MKVIQFANCVVNYWPENDFLRTIFEDGSECPALFSFAAESLERAYMLGYLLGTRGETADRNAMRFMQLEHELAHTFIAELQGLPCCPVLYSVAHNLPNETAWEQEELVMDFQRYLNIEPVGDRLRKLEQSGVDLIGARFEFSQLMRRP